MKTQGWAIVGTGKVSRSIASDLRGCAAEIVVVHSRSEKNAAAFAAEFGIARSTSNYEVAISDPAVEIVYIATPFTTHFSLAREAIAAGKHVLVEKPMAMNAAEVRELFTLAQAAGVFLMEGMWLKFNPGFQQALAEIAAGRIGEPRSLRAAFSMPMPEGGSRWQLEGSPGALLDQGIYPVTLAHTIFGSPLSIHAGGHVNDDGIDLAEHFMFEYGAGRWAIGASSMVDLGESSAAISGTKGWIEIPTMFWATTSFHVHADSWDQITVNPLRIELPREGYGYVPMLREVIAAVGSGRVEHPLHDARMTIEIFEMLDEIRRQLPGSP